MTPRFPILLGGMCALLLPLPLLGQAPADDKGVEVLARGPVHEAFAEPLDPKPAAGPLHPKQPPDPIDELPPDQKPVGDNVVWIPGYWSWDDDRADYIWVSGFWRVPPPNRVWMPGSWRQEANGWHWVGGFWGGAVQQTAEIQYLPPPPAPVEAGPATPAPSATAIYVPGSWVYQTSRYLWRPGYWTEFKPGWIWIPAHYRWTPCGHVYIDGYWDYPLAGRGILFAPVYISPTAYARPSYYYSPTIVVQENCMYGALFVRGGRSCYYFGDYFGPTYASAGYVSWVGYSGGSNVVMVRGFHDPMYSYYRVSYRDDPYWRGGITELYVGRYRGDIPAPPRTLVQQTTIINNTVVNNTTVINNKTVNVTQVHMLTPISQAAKTNPNLKLQTISTQARLEQRQAAYQMKVAGQERGKLESQLAAKGPLRANDAPRTLKVNVPKTTAAVRSTPSHTSVAPAANQQPLRHELPIVPNRTTPVVGKPNAPQPNPLHPDPTKPPLAPTNVPPGTPGANPAPKPAAKTVAHPHPSPPPKKPAHDKN